MFPQNILSYCWMVFIFVFCTMFILYRIPTLPNFLWNLISYGKVRNVSGRGKPSKKQTWQSKLDKVLDVPKRWFIHFYIVSVICNSFLLFNLISVVFYNGEMPGWYLDVLRFLTNYPLQNPKASQLSIIIVIALLLIQGVRRLYECLVISSYSNSTIHISHYILGLLFYAFAGINVVAEGPELTGKVQMDSVRQLAEQLEWFHVAGILMFLWATYHHHVAHKIFAGLRTGHKDRSHRIPHGDWFELVSSPHYLAEILIYASLIIVLGFQHSMIYLVFFFTLANQVFASISVHEWYRQKFDNYPKGRKAIIPWLL
ncbi:polyprenal reductase-like [Asterias amurensis]|uniref:polyprenal reductase-like n=1 Tax=Asterias amurensis TaxID=7602 RepID=UPI003AB89D9F